MSKLRWTGHGESCAWRVDCRLALGPRDLRRVSDGVWNAGVTGGLIAILAAIDLDTPASWEEWAMGALGLWAIVSPWVLGFAAQRPMTVGCVAAGGLVAALSRTRDSSVIPEVSRLQLPPKPIESYFENGKSVA